MPRSNLSEDGTIVKEISYDHNESNVLPPSCIFHDASVLCVKISLGIIID